MVAQLTSVIDPLAVDPAPPPQRRLIVGAWHDRMAMREPAIALQERWGGQLYWYDGSHVGHVFSRRVQRVTERFLREVAGTWMAANDRARGRRAKWSSSTTSWSGTNATSALAEELFG